MCFIQALWYNLICCVVFGSAVIIIQILQGGLAENGEQNVELHFLN